MIRRTRHDTVREIIIRDLQPSFSFPIFDRITIIADVEHYTKDDPWVRDQSRGNKPDYYEIYWDMTWICDFTTAQPPRIVYLNFWHGMLNAYMTGQIQLNEWLKGFDDIGAKVDDELLKSGMMATNDKGVLAKTDKMINLEKSVQESEEKAKQAKEKRVEKVVKKLENSHSEIDRVAGQVIKEVHQDKKLKESLKKGSSVVH